MINQDGEFYPFGAEIDNQGKLTHIGHFDGDDFPLSQTKINELRKYFEKEIKNISGVDKITSSSFQDYGMIIVEFEDKITILVIR